MHPFLAKTGLDFYRVEEPKLQILPAEKESWLLIISSGMQEKKMAGFLYPPANCLLHLWGQLPSFIITSKGEGKKKRV